MGETLFISFIITFGTGVFTTISNIAEENKNSKIDNIRDSIAKANSDTLFSQSTEALKQNKISFDTLKDVQKKAIALNDSLAKELVLQGETNKSSKILVENLKLEKRDKKESNKFELKSSIKLLSESFRQVWLLYPNKNLEIEDSIRLVQKFLSYIAYTNNILASQLQNEELLTNNKLYNLWVYCLQKLDQVEFRLYGYDPLPLVQVENILGELGRIFRNMNVQYEQENEMKTDKRVKKMPDFYAIPKNL